MLPSDDGGMGAGTSDGGCLLVEKFATKETNLIDMNGGIVNSWKSQYVLKGGSHLLANGDLLRSGLVGRNTFYKECPGFTGVVERFNWEGELQWTYVLAESRYGLHHDIEPLPNGNVLMLVVDVIGREEQLANGRDPANMKTDDLWVDSIIEVKPTGKNGGKVVWEWRLWDHLVQDFDPSKKNHGIVAEHPASIDVNFIENPVPVTASAMRHMQSIGYVGGGDKASAPLKGSLPDWTHANAIRYNAALDQILISFRSLSEVWIIDHSTSVAEATSKKGGKQGKGGGILYRWGNPQAYHSGGPADQKLFGQHDAQWIKPGLPGAGNLLIFNNGDGRKDGAFTTIEEIRSPSSPTGGYTRASGSAFGPVETVWRYGGGKGEPFYAQLLSGAQRLANGNTQICDGLKGHVFEVTKAGNKVWEWTYVPPKRGVHPQGPGGARGPVLGTQAMFRAVRYEKDFAGFAGRDIRSERLD